MHSPPNKDMDFLAGLVEVMSDRRITRREWGDPSIYVLLRDGFLSIKNQDGYHRLLVSESDMFAKDWIVVQDIVTVVND